MVLLQLIKVGLWGDRELENLIESVKKGGFDWEEVMELAKQQTCVGVVADALARLPMELRPPKKLYFNVIAATGDIEKQNKEMNEFVPILMDKLKSKGVLSLLLKGQGLALLYPNPLHRQCGDIDLLIPKADQFRWGAKLLKRISTSWDWEKDSQHAEFNAMGFVVELHCEYAFTINRRVTKALCAWNEDLVYLSIPRGSYVYKDAYIIDYLDDRRINGMYLPSPQFNAVFVFAHMLNHFMTGGVGLRQISDWMMVLSAQFDEIDQDKLMEDLLMLDLVKSWKTFGAMIVKLLGMPKEKVPFYDNKYEKKAEILMDAIFKTGNFGTLQKEKQLSTKSNKWLKKVHTALGQVPVYWRAGKIFPMNSIYCFYKYSKASLFG